MISLPTTRHEVLRSRAVPVFVFCCALLLLLPSAGRGAAELQPHRSPSPTVQSAAPLCAAVPLSCVFFDMECLAERPEATAKVATFVDAVTRGFTLDNMFGAFVSGLGLFSIARLGGIPGW
eukprot:646831-Prymnesium_polylepis.1